jgi:hypothetical protein
MNRSFLWSTLAASNLFLFGACGGESVQEQATESRLHTQEVACAGTIRISSEADIASVKERGCTTITGELLIVNTPLTSLAGLETVTSVGGNLVVRGNAALKDLRGLDGVTSVGEILVIGENDSLTSLHGLDALTNVGSDAVVRTCNQLTNLQGLDALRSVGGLLIVRNNNSLTSLSGLDGVTKVGQLTVSQNPALPACAADALLSGLEVASGPVSCVPSTVCCSAPTH